MNLLNVLPKPASVEGVGLGLNFMARKCAERTNDETTSCKYDESVATYKIMLLIQDRRTVHVWPGIAQSV